MSDKVFFKIVVPNYNNIAYIKQCLDSILNQTYQDFKIVVVDDMSTDFSNKFCEMYSRQYPDKLTFIQLNQKGFAGAARNVGIDYDIESEYTWFVDADDYIYDDNTLLKLHDFIVDSNYHDIYTVDYKTDLNGKLSNLQHVKAEINNKTLCSSALRGTPFKVIKSEKCEKFLENCTFGEDIYQIAKQLNTTTDIVETNIFAYVVRLNIFSTTQDTTATGKGKDRKQHRELFYSKMLDLSNTITNDVIKDMLITRLQYDERCMSKNNKICVISAATKNLKWQYDKTNFIKQQYCDKYGYTFKFIELDVDTKKSYFSRQDLILENLKNYEYVVWMDVDAWFNNFDINLLDIIEKYLVDDISLLCAADHDIKSPKDFLFAYINSGILVFKSNKHSEKIIELWKKQTDDVVALKNAITKLNDQPFLSTRILFDDFVNTHTARITATELNWFIWHEPTNDKFILHAAGIKLRPNRDKIFYNKLDYTIEKYIKNA